MPQEGTRDVELSRPRRVQREHILAVVDTAFGGSCRRPWLPSRVKFLPGYAPAFASTAGTSLPVLFLPDGSGRRLAGPCPTTAPAGNHRRPHAENWHLHVMPSNGWPIFNVNDFNDGVCRPLHPTSALRRLPVALIGLPPASP